MKLMESFSIEVGPKCSAGDLDRNSFSAVLKLDRV